MSTKIFQIKKINFFIFINPKTTVIFIIYNYYIIIYNNISLKFIYIIKINKDILLYY